MDSSQRATVTELGPFKSATGAKNLSVEICVDWVMGAMWMDGHKIWWVQAIWECFHEYKLIHLREKRGVKAQAGEG